LGNPKKKKRFGTKKITEPAKPVKKSGTREGTPRGKGKGDSLGGTEKGTNFLELHAGPRVRPNRTRWGGKFGEKTDV